MIFFDTHVHFDALDGEYGAQALIERAGAAGVKRMIAVGGSEKANSIAVDVAKQFSTEVAAAIGYDRDQAEAPSPRPLALKGADGGPQAAPGDLREEIRRAAGKGVRVVAIGEIGLDFYYAPETADAQVMLLREQLALARALALPVIVHSREADERTIAELRAHAAAWGGTADRIGVLHCFTGGKTLAKQVLDLGLHISFSGILTFRNASALRDVARFIPDDKLIIETDAPYLAPVPHRGRRNEPAYLPQVAATLAQVRGCAIETMASLTTANAERLFGW